MKKQKENWNYLSNQLKEFEDVLILPQKEENADPSWFGFLITVREDAEFTRDELAQYLEENNVQTRNLFAGNIIKHPCFDEIRENHELYRVVGELKETDNVMNRTFWIGVYPGMNEAKLQYMIHVIGEFIKTKR